MDVSMFRIRALRTSCVCLAGLLALLSLMAWGLGAPPFLLLHTLAEPMSGAAALVLLLLCLALFGSEEFPDLVWILLAAAVALSLASLFFRLSLPLAPGVDAGTFTMNAGSAVVFFLFSLALAMVFAGRAGGGWWTPCALAPFVCVVAFLFANLFLPLGNHSLRGLWSDWVLLPTPVSLGCTILLLGVLPLVVPREMKIEAPVVKFLATIASVGICCSVVVWREAEFSLAETLSGAGDHYAQVFGSELDSFMRNQVAFTLLTRLDNSLRRVEESPVVPRNSFETLVASVVQATPGLLLVGRLGTQESRAFEVYPNSLRARRVLARVRSLQAEAGAEGVSLTSADEFAVPGEERSLLVFREPEREGRDGLVMVYDFVQVVEQLRAPLDDDFGLVLTGGNGSELYSDGGALHNGSGGAVMGEKRVYSHVLPSGLMVLTLVPRWKRFQQQGLFPPDLVLLSGLLVTMMLLVGSIAVDQLLQMLGASREQNDSLERTQRELARVQEQLEHKNRELRAFNSHASRDLMVPLAAIDEMVEELSLSSSEGDIKERPPDAAVHDVQEIRAITFRMRLLLDDLYKYACLEGRGSEALTTVSLERLLEECCSEIQGAAEAQIRWTSGLPKLQTYEGPLRLVLRHLIANAIQHNERSEPHIAIDIHQLGDRLVVGVSDDGPGIPAGKEKDIFLPFTSFSKNSAGGGLGLAAVERAVKAHGGALQVVSEPGIGATFTFTWPVVALEEKEEMVPSER